MIDGGVGIGNLAAESYPVECRFGAADRKAHGGDQRQLAISLHAATEELRGRLMPVNRKYSLEQLIDCCRNLPLPRRKRITFEYVLLRRCERFDRGCAGACAGSYAGCRARST